MRPMLCLLLTAVGVVALAFIAANAWVIGAARAYVYDHIDRIPSNPVGVVLGTSPYTRNGNPNLLFSHRIKAAAELYEAGKVDHLLLSGANPGAAYNEPQLMYQALVEAGVPGSAMTMDFAGLRTFDSMVRAARIFGLEEFTIVSQRFHNYRAVFIARHRGIDAVAYVRPEEDPRQKFRVEAREFLARAAAILDLYVLNTKPRFLGPPRELQIDRPDDAQLRKR